MSFVGANESSSTQMGQFALTITGYIVNGPNWDITYKPQIHWLPFLMATANSYEAIDANGCQREYIFPL